jgi:hypothetical protein
MAEKVWAKMNGNYENTNQGNPGESLAFLTGVPYYYYANTDTSTINSNGETAFAVISDADTKKYVIAAEVGNGNPYGLLDSHAYAVIGAY